MNSWGRFALAPAAPSSFAERRGWGRPRCSTYLEEQATGFRVARAVGISSEMELAYSGLHQLCGPMLDVAEQLPAAQREALETAFGLGQGPPPERFLVGIAVLSLFAVVAEDQPLVVHRRRCAVARSGIGTDPRLRRSSSPRRAGDAGRGGPNRDRRHRPRRGARTIRRLRSARRMHAPCSSRT